MNVLIVPWFLHSKIQARVSSHRPHHQEDMELRALVTKIEQTQSMNMRTYQDFSMLKYQGCNQMSCKKMINDCLILGLSCLVEKSPLQS